MTTIKAYVEILVSYVTDCLFELLESTLHVWNILRNWWSFHSSDLRVASRPASQVFWLWDHLSGDTWSGMKTAVPGGGWAPLRRSPLKVELSNHLQIFAGVLQVLTVVSDLIYDSLFQYYSIKICKFFGECVLSQLNITVAESEKTWLFLSGWKNSVFSLEV